MKILVLNFEYPPLGGGASPVCYHICTELRRKGHEITVVTMGFEGLQEDERSEGVRIIRIPSGRKKKNMSYPLEHLRFLRNARSFLKSHLTTAQYDVLHCHFILSTGILARWINRKFKIPFIITAHGSDLPGFNPDRFNLIHVFSPPAIRRILKSCAAIVSPSEFLSTLIKPHLEEKEKLKIIPNGIEEPETLPLHKEKIILSTGRLLKRKGFHTLIKAVKAHKFNYEVHICGDGPYRQQLEELSQNSATKVVFHGWLDNTSEMYIKLLRKAEIYCLVSPFENASIALLEAMAHGCAIITADEGGTAEMVKDCGILVPAEDPVRLKESLVSLSQDPEMVDDLREKAVQRVKQHYTWQAIADQYEDLLREVAEV